MKKYILIKRRREIVIEVESSPSKNKRKDKPETFDIKISSIVMISRRIDEFEENIRKKMESEMRIFTCETHTQEFLRSLIPSLNKDRKC